MNKTEISDLMMKMFKNRVQVMRMLIQEFEDTRKVADGCQRVLDSWEDGYQTPENMQKQLRTAISTNRRQAVMLEKLALICLLYVMGDSYTSDAAHALNKLGHGQDALREMWEQKLRGD